MIINKFGMVLANIQLKRKARQELPATGKWGQHVYKNS